MTEHAEKKRRNGNIWHCADKTLAATTLLRAPLETHPFIMGFQTEETQLSMPNCVCPSVKNKNRNP